jgi:single-strand DNA-binding protein
VAASVNKVILVGNLGQDPKVRYTQQGTAVCGFSVATSDSWTDKQGQKQERVEWVRVSVWGKQAEQCGEYLAKGRQVFVEGRLKTTQSEKGGQTIYYTEVVAHTVQFLGSKQEGGQRQKQDLEPPRSAQEYATEETDDVPF